MKSSTFEAHHIGAVTLQQIRCFSAVAGRQTYRGLARELGMEQRAVSRSVMRLEEILGGKLFEPRDRTRRTAFGEKVYREAGRILGMVESLKLLALDEAGKGRAAGVVTIGTKSSFAETLLPKLIGRFRAKHGRASIRVRCGSGDDLIRMLQAADIDLAVSHRRPPPDGVAFKRLWTFPRLLVMPKGHPLAGGTITAGKLAAASLILPSRNSGTCIEIMAILSKVTTAERLKSFIEVTSSEARIRYAAAGLGAAVVDGSARDIIPASLAARPLPARLLPERDAGVYYSTERYTPQSVIRFMEAACGFKPSQT